MSACLRGLIQVMPSLFDYWSLLRHGRSDCVAPWLAQRRGEALFSVSGSVLALHVPSQQASGLGRLVVDRRGDAAFITGPGVCWEIPQLSRVVDQVFETESGDLTFFVSEPIGLQVSISVADSRHLLAVLNDPSLIGNEYWEVSMGLFGKPKGSGEANFLFPPGEAPPVGVEVSMFLAKTALARTSSSGIPSDDVYSYVDASYAHVLGVPESSTILAWGDARIQTPQDSRPHDGTVVVTADTMLAYWQPGRTSLIHTFQGSHSAVTSSQIDAGREITAVWSVGEYANNDGKFLVGDALVRLEPKFGKDGHANRRALTWFACLRVFLDLVPPAEGPGSQPHPDSGFGSGGTKL